MTKYFIGLYSVTILYQWPNSTNILNRKYLWSLEKVLLEEQTTNELPFHWINVQLFQNDEELKNLIYSNVELGCEVI